LFFCKRLKAVELSQSKIAKAIIKIKIQPLIAVIYAANLLIYQQVIFVEKKAYCGKMNR